MLLFVLAVNFLYERMEKCHGCPNRDLISTYNFESMCLSMAIKKVREKLNSKLRKRNSNMIKVKNLSGKLGLDSCRPTGAV